MSIEADPQDDKIPQLRNLYTKVGMFGVPSIDDVNPGDNAATGPQVRGNRFQQEGAVDTLFRFFSRHVFDPVNDNRVGFAGGDAQRRDVEQFMFAFDNDLAPIVGQQITLDATNAAVVGPRIDLLIARARTPFASKVLGPDVTECDLVARGVIGGRVTSFVLGRDGRFHRDGGRTLSDRALRAVAAIDGQQITYTCLPPGWTR